jgi:hypothetical protein
MCRWQNFGLCFRTGSMTSMTIINMNDISLKRQSHENDVWDFHFCHTSTLFLQRTNIHKGVLNINGIVSRDFVVCFLVSFDRSAISTHQERVLLLLKVRFHNEFFDFRVRPKWAPEGKWRLNLSKYGAHTQDILLLFMSIITENPVRKIGAKSWACKKSSG